MESYAVEMTRQAEEQLSEIVQYISLTLRSPQAGMNTLDALEEEIGSLSVMPFRYPAIEDDPAEACQHPCRLLRPPGTEENNRVCAVPFRRALLRFYVESFQRASNI